MANPIEAYKRLIFKSAKADSDTLTGIDVLLFAGFICNVLLLIVSLVGCLCDPVNDLTRFLDNNVAPHTLKTSIAYILFSILFVKYVNLVYNSKTKIYEELSGKDYENFMLTVIYSFLCMILSPVTYIYLVVKYSFIVIATVCEFCIIKIPNTVIHLLCGNHAVTEEPPKKDLNLLSDYNKLLSK